MSNFSRRLMIALDGDLTLSKADERRLKHPAVGGIILFARNFSDGRQLRQLTAAIRRAAPIPLLIAVDQEGGRVQRFIGGGFTKLPPMAAVARHAEAESLAQAAGCVMAAELLAAGVEYSFAPVLDVDSGKSSVIGDRAFSSNARQTAMLALALARGMAAAGMQCCGKHFPGHGAASADSHTDSPADERPLSEIEARDLVPFQQWAAQGMAAVMSAHVRYPLVDAAAATFSRRWLRDILRRRLGFQGAIISDDLSMAGADIGAPERRLRAAAEAGCDLFLLCNLEETESALTTMSASAGGDNPWRRLAPRAAGRVCIGDGDYRRARKIVGYNGDMTMESASIENAGRA